MSLKHLTSLVTPDDSLQEAQDDNENGDDEDEMDATNLQDSLDYITEHNTCFAHSTGGKGRV